MSLLRAVDVVPLFGRIGHKHNSIEKYFWALKFDVDVYFVWHSSFDANYRENMIINIVSEPEKTVRTCGEIISIEFTHRERASTKQPSTHGCCDF